MLFKMCVRELCVDTGVKHPALCYRLAQIFFGALSLFVDLLSVLQ